MSGPHVFLDFSTSGKEGGSGCEGLATEAVNPGEPVRLKDTCGGKDTSSLYGRPVGTPATAAVVPRTSVQNSQKASRPEVFPPKVFLDQTISQARVAITQLLVRGQLVRILMSACLDWCECVSERKQRLFGVAEVGLRDSLPCGKATTGK